MTLDWVSRRRGAFGMATPAASVKVAADATLETEFQTLVGRWREETLGHWNAAIILAHPAHQQIIEMGEDALPLIFADLAAGGGHWWRALREITGENPVPEEDRGWSKKMRHAWVEWGMERGYLQ